MKSLLLLIVALAKSGFSLQCIGNTCQCPGGGDFDRNTFCDGKADCSNGFDEADVICKFYCNDPANTVIPRMEYGFPASFCDGVNDCPNGVDEENCGFTPMYKCGAGNLITTEQFCNGAKDCEDGIDEITCTQGCFTVEDCKELLPNYATTIHVKWNSCLVYVDDITLDWDGAKAWCDELHDGSLLYYPTEYANDPVALKDQFGLTGDTWFGLRQRENSSTPTEGWQWHRAHGIQNAGDNIPWYSTEPNDYGGNEDCGTISATHQFKLTDLVCSAQQHFMCQYRP